MSTEVKFRKGTKTQSDVFTGALAEITVDTTTETLRVHDGANPGGSELVNLTANQTLENKTIDSPVLSGSITADDSTGTSGQYLESTGNGVQWSNIDTASISNGNSNVSVSENSDITVSISDSTSATFSSDGLVIAGNLTVNGTTTVVNSNEVSIGDSVIDLNADISSSTSPTQDGGFTIFRGSEANKSLIWNEATDKWSVGSETFVAETFEGNLSGDVTGQVSDISNHSTSDLSEGSNLYFTDTRARNALSAGGDLNYDSNTGEFSVTVPVGYDSSEFDTDFSNKSTSDLSEGTNLYYTDARVDGHLSGGTGVSYSSGNISIGQDVGTGSSVTFSGITIPNIDKSGSDGSGNIGSDSNSFNTVFAKATSAQYADVAEKYVSDNAYSSATVIKIGGEKEVTISTKYADSRVAGVVTTNPALLMNKDLQSEYVTAVALTGRVPCQVMGVIKKGDVLTTSDIPGVATRLFNEDFVPGCVIGKALEDYNEEQPGTIEILVGKV